MRILLVEDETELATVITDQLARGGYQVEAVATGAAGLAAVHDRRPDLVLLDLNLPDIDGLSVCVTIRAAPGHLPILLLTARSGRDAELAGYAAHADGYVTKPFDTEVLLARIAATLRLAGLHTQRRFTLGAADIDLDARSVTRHGQRQAIVGLTFALLEFLLDHPNQTFGKNTLTQRVWGAPLAGRRVDNHISKLRAAIEVNPNDPQIIVTLTGVGYRLHLPPTLPEQSPDPVLAPATTAIPVPGDPWRPPPATPSAPRSRR